MVEDTGPGKEPFRWKAAEGVGYSSGFDSDIARMSFSRDYLPMSLGVIDRWISSRDEWNLPSRRFEDTPNTLRDKCYCPRLT